MVSQNPYDTHPGVMINGAKFYTTTSSSFGEVRTHTHTGIIVLFVWIKTWLEVVILKILFRDKNN